jgi:hypothetical protein
MLRYARMDRVWSAAARCKVLICSELKLGNRKPATYLRWLLQHFRCQSLGKPTELITRLFGERWVDRLGRCGQ